MMTLLKVDFLYGEQTICKNDKYIFFYFFYLLQLSSAIDKKNYTQPNKQINKQKMKETKEKKHTQPQSQSHKWVAGVIVSII